MQFSLRQALIGVAAIAIPLAAGVSAARGIVCTFDGSAKPLLDENVFWTVAAAELLVFAWVALIRHADAARREMESQSDDADLQP
jgi:hypothetical protein